MTAYWRALWIMTVACGCAASGCMAGTRATSPETALQKYAQAVREGDAETAYALLSSDAKSRMSFAMFQRTLKERPEDLQGVADALGRPGRQLEISALVRAEDGSQLELVLEDGAWRAELSAIELYSQATPLKALESFVRAFEASRYDVLMRFAPSSHREGLTQAQLQEAWQGEQKREMQELVQALKVQLPTARAEIVGDRATVAYGAAGAVQLLLEDGAWKIEEF